MCIFCDIASKKAPAKLVYEDEEIVAFPDIHPVAPVHLLIIPKKHIASVNDLSDADQALVGKMILVAKKLAQENKIDQSGYRLVINCGKDGGQIIEHLHLHLLGGKKLEF
jgi:histidine triad (HIT) family protein